MKTIRTTVSLPTDQHEKLQTLAEANGLSVAWMVRQAVGEFLCKVDAGDGFSPLSGYKTVNVEESHTSGHQENDQSKE